MLISDFLFESTETFLDEDLEGQKAQRGQFIINKLGPNWDPKSIGFNTAQEFVEKLGEVDPSLKGIYMPWLAKLIISKPNENRVEDLERVGGDLRAFETYKARIANKDINSYKSFQDLYDVIAPFLAPKQKSKEELAAEKNAAKMEKLKQEIIVVYNGPEGWIRIPTTRESAIFLGQNTRWCTAALNSNQFDYYHKSDSLFVVYNKADKSRSQLHINSGQFAGEDDRNKGIQSVPDWARQPIVDWYKANNPQLSLKQIMNLNSFTDENLGAGTEHEDLLNLMKQYGV